MGFLGRGSQPAPNHCPSPLAIRGLVECCKLHSEVRGRNPDRSKVSLLSRGAMQTSGDGLLPPPLKSAHGVVLYSSVAMVGVRAVSFLSRRTRFYFVAPAETLAFWEIMRYAAKQQLTRSMPPT